MISWNDQDIVAEYQRWMESPAGSLALRAKMKLISDLMAGWPRRGRRMLDIGCATGCITEMYYHAGFDVTGFDHSTRMLQVAQERMGARAEFFLGQAEHLPFDDNQFDFVNVGSIVEFVDDPVAILAEALRVASSAVIITAYSKWSLYYLLRKHIPEEHLKNRNWLNPFALHSMLRGLAGDADIVRRSILLGPVCTWKEQGAWQWINTRLLPYGVGTLSGIQVDVCDTKISIPLKVEKYKTNHAFLNACRTNMAARNSSSTFDK
ncbi:MAG: class I SAM-dependent methyltransferase [Desulfovibrionales bacterium]|nr:class I SAM-dependent methyltransferase [Desulfovibrionales bacterium]